MRVRIYQEVRLELSAMVFFAALIMTILTTNRYVLGGSGPDSRLPDFLRDIDGRIGNWMVWVAFLGTLLLLGGGWYFGDTIRKRKEFNRLIAMDSKAKFVRNQDRLEQLAYYYLGSEYRKRVEAKKKEFDLV